MPIYEYRCNTCETLTEKICSSEQKEIECPQCGEPARRIVSVFAAKAGGSAAGPTCRPSPGFS